MFKKTLFYSCLISLLLVCGCSDSTAPVAGEQNFTFKGRVFSQDGATPIKNVRVKLGTEECSTDNTGFFLFESVSEGTYEIEISHPFFIQFSENVSIIEDTENNYSLIPQEYIITDTLSTVQSNNLSLHPWLNNGEYNFALIQQDEFNNVHTAYSSPVSSDGLIFLDENLLVFNSDIAYPVNSFFKVAGELNRMEFSDHSAKLSIINLEVRHPNQGELNRPVYIETGSQPVKSVVMFYADKPVFISGANTAADNSMKIETDLDFSEGINFVLLTYLYSGQTILMRYETIYDLSTLDCNYLVEEQM